MRKKTILITIASVLAIILIRVFFNLFPSYKIDIEGYKAWSLHLANGGAKTLYSTFHVVYAPIYMYILWFAGKLSILLKLDSKALELLIKSSSILFDLVSAYLIFKIGEKYGKKKTGILLGISYILNPAIIFNSLWGQFDSLPAALLLAMLYCFCISKNNTALFIYLAAVLTKPQSALVLPIVILLYIKDFNFKNLKCLINFMKTIAAGLLFYIAVILPFYNNTIWLKNLINAGNATFVHKIADLLYWMPNIYFNSINDYPFATANAFNFWTIAGGQPINDSNVFLGVSFNTWGLIMFAFVIICILIYLFKTYMFKIKESVSPFFSMYLLLLGSFVFLTRMHERYLLPAIIFITVSTLWDPWLSLSLAGVSICVLANQWYVYTLAKKEIYWLQNYDTFAVIFAFITLQLFIVSLFHVYKFIKKSNNSKFINNFNNSKNINNSNNSKNINNYMNNNISNINYIKGNDVICE